MTHPMTSPIARDAAERIVHHGKYGNDLAIIAPLIESALQAHLAQAIKESGAIEALEKSKRGHYYCEDTWYSCPKHSEGCANDNAGTECDCGADEANATIDAALLRLRALSGEGDGR